VPIVSSTRQVACPRCGAWPAALTQTDYYSSEQSASLNQRFQLDCPNGCVASQRQLSQLRVLDPDEAP
jgi:hypothetical protein